MSVFIDQQLRQRSHLYADILRAQGILCSVYHTQCHEQKYRVFDFCVLFLMNQSFILFKTNVGLREFDT